MKKKKILIAVAVSAALVVPLSVFAATSDTQTAKTVRGFFGFDTSKLTDEQKADVEDYTQKMADLQKEFINKMVANGAMTQEQADAAIQKIDDMLANGDGSTFLPGFGMGKGVLNGREMKGAFGLGNIDTSKLTDQQKEDLLNSYKEIAELQKDLINNMVNDGLMTQEQGTSAAAKVDDIVNKLETQDLSNVIGMVMVGLGDFDCFGVRGIDTSNLTDQQKADLTDYSQKMSELRKELISKAVTYGLITQEQGDTITQKIDNTQKNIEENGFSNGVGMRKGFSGKLEGRGGHWKNDDSNGSDSTNNSTDESSNTQTT